MAESITTVIELLRSKDKAEQLRGFGEAERYLDSALVDAEAIPELVDAIVPALSNSNPKFVQEALGLLIALVEVMGEDLAPYTGGVWSPLVDKLGDSKNAIRERAVDLAVALATLVVPAAQALERIRPAWEHKNWRARESSLLWLGRVLASQDSPSAVGFPLKGLLPHLVKPLEDREPPVREAATLAIEQMLRHQGDPLINELNRSQVRPNVLKPLLVRLGAETPAAAPQSGGFSARNGGLHSSSGLSHGSADGGSSPAQSPGRRSCVSDPAAAPHRPASARSHDAAAVGGGGASSRRPASPAQRAPSSARGPPPGAFGTSGAEALVEIEEVPPVAVYSDRELGVEMTAIHEQLKHADDWAVRSTALRRLHSLVLGGACDFDSFAGHLKTMKDALVAQLAELRSSLVRDACAALGAAAEKMRESFEPFCIDFVPPMLKQTTVTIQVIREASNLGLRTLLVYATPAKVTPRLLVALADRSSSLRKNAIEYVRLLLEATPVHSEGERCPLEKHADALATALKAALTDAIAEVRATARLSFWAYHRHFPSRTARLLPTLDASTHKLVLEEQASYAARVERGEIAQISGNVHALGELVALMKAPERRAEVGAHADKTVALVLERLSDAHYRVVHAALTCTCTLAATFPNALEPSLERLLPQLLIRTQETRDTVRAVAHAALQAVQAAFSPETLLPVLLRIVDVPTPRVRASALQLLAAAAASAQPYLSTPSHMRACVAKTHPHLADKNADLRRATLAALHALHETAPAVFVTQLLRQLAGTQVGANHRDALLKLQKMALCAPADAAVWVAHFEHALEAILRAMQATDEKIRELSMACMKDLLRSQAKRFKAFTEHVLLRLLAAGRDASRDVAAAAEDALELLLSLSDAHRCMAVLVPVVMKEATPTLQMAVRLQSKLVPRFSQLQLLAILPQVLPPLFEAFKNPNADVRKAVVFCLVDMYMVLGEQLTPHLAVLSTSQLKLVTIYINRTAKARADRDASSPEGAASALAYSNGSPKPSQPNGMLLRNEVC
ncbi:clip-associating protein [Chrysochromulina tobinii]|uniref:Clip-associating protein n=1 Tax=Chrysochromulina tobinii TaxID=1460289 RepID=A0A0M0K2S0_9EUKA|nr:clip-associating protein [Chrysochromulina tobinii]|eukprot:KOO32683.1 clip-associating protein [Chrysochromulina sp. CCMP291]